MSIPDFNITITETYTGEEADKVKRQLEYMEGWCRQLSADVVAAGQPQMTVGQFREHFTDRLLDIVPIDVAPLKDVTVIVTPHDDGTFSYEIKE